MRPTESTRRKALNNYYRWSSETPTASKRTQGEELELVSRFPEFFDFPRYCDSLR